MFISVKKSILKSICTFCLLLSVAIVSAQVPQSERDALIALYNATDGPNWSRNENWLSEDVSTWYGVWVDYGHVFAISLTYNNLQGELPDELGDLTELIGIGLNSNYLSGQIPESLSNLILLEDVNLAENQFSGAVPEFFTSFQYLRYLNLKANYFTDLPDFSGTNLQSLYVTFNCFTFEDIEPNINIPSINYDRQHELQIEPDEYLVQYGETFSLSINVGGQYNQYQWFFGGETVTTVSADPELSFESFSGDNEGGYYCEITNTLVTNLILRTEWINLYEKIPQSEYNALEAFYEATNGDNWLYKGNWFTSQVSSWYGIELEEGHVSMIYLPSNNLTGEIPTEIENLTYLKYLKIQGNLISGSIPIEICNLMNLEQLGLTSNHLTGHIPPQIGNLQNLQDLGLNNNQFEGEIPVEIGNLNSLIGLYLSSNQLTGQIPQEFGNLNSLWTLDFSMNNLSGCIPESLIGLNNIVEINLQNNYFDCLPDLSYFNQHILYVGNNNFTFGDLEPNSQILSYHVGPQAKIPVSNEHIVIASGNSLELSISTDGENNQYQWFRDGASVSQLSSDPEFLIQPVSLSDAGNYTCQVTNTLITRLSLESEIINVEVIPVITQTTHLSANWNIFSTYVEPLDNSCSAVIGDAGLTSSMSIVKNEAGAAYFPSLDFGGFTIFDVGEGYQAKMVSGEDFEITGLPIDPEDVTLTLQPGWNMLGYLRQSAGALTDMLDPVLGSIEIIKDESGLAYYPSLGFGLLNTLEPGEGYMVKMVSQASFSYPSNGAKSGITKLNFDEEPQYFGSPKNTGFNMTLIIPEKAWDVLPEHGDELAVFAPDGRLVGSAVLKNAHNMLPVFGDDLTSETKDGLSDGEAFTLQLWHKSSGEIQTLEITNWQDWAPGQQIYQHNGIAVVGKIKSGSSVTGIDAESAKMSFSLYPNPVKDELKIHFNTKRHSNCSISIYNSIGQCVKDISGISSAQQTVSVDTQALKAGVYVVHIQSAERSKNITFIKSGN